MEVTDRLNEMVLINPDKFYSLDNGKRDISEKQLSGLEEKLRELLGFGRPILLEVVGEIEEEKKRKDELKKAYEDTWDSLGDTFNKLLQEGIIGASQFSFLDGMVSAIDVGRGQRFLEGKISQIMESGREVPEEISRDYIELTAKIIHSFFDRMELTLVDLSLLRPGKIVLEDVYGKLRNNLLGLFKQECVIVDAGTERFNPEGLFELAKKGKVELSDVELVVSSIFNSVLEHSRGSRDIFEGLSRGEEVGGREGIEKIVEAQRKLKEMIGEKERLDKELEGLRQIYNDYMGGHTLSNEEVNGLRARIAGYEGRINELDSELYGLGQERDRLERLNTGIKAERDKLTQDYESLEDETKKLRAQLEALKDIPRGLSEEDARKLLDSVISGIREQGRKVEGLEGSVNEASERSLEAYQKAEKLARETQGVRGWIKKLVYTSVGLLVLAAGSLGLTSYLNWKGEQHRREAFGDVRDAVAALDDKVSGLGDRVDKASASVVQLGNAVGIYVNELEIVLGDARAVNEEFKKGVEDLEDALHDNDSFKLELQGYVNKTNQILSKAEETLAGIQGKGIDYTTLGNEIKELKLSVGGLYALVGSVDNKEVLEKLKSELDERLAGIDKAVQNYSTGLSGVAREDEERVASVAKAVSDLGNAVNKLRGYVASKDDVSGLTSSINGVNASVDFVSDLVDGVNGKVDGLTTMASRIEGGMATKEDVKNIGENTYELLRGQVQTTNAVDGVNNSLKEQQDKLKGIEEKVDGLPTKEQIIEGVDEKNNVLITGIEAVGSSVEGTKKEIIGEVKAAEERLTGKLTENSNLFITGITDARTGLEAGITRGIDNLEKAINRYAGISQEEREGVLKGLSSIEADYQRMLSLYGELKTLSDGITIKLGSVATSDKADKNLELASDIITKADELYRTLNGMKADVDGVKTAVLEDNEGWNTALTQQVLGLEQRFTGLEREVSGIGDVLFGVSGKEVDYIVSGFSPRFTYNLDGMKFQEGMEKATRALIESVVEMHGGADSFIGSRISRRYQDESNFKSFVEKLSSGMKNQEDFGNEAVKLPIIGSDFGSR